MEVEKAKRPTGIWRILDAVAKRLPIILLFLGLGLNLLLAVAAGRPPLAHCQLGACRWLRLGPTTIQVSDFLKLGVMLYLAKITADFQARGGFLEEAGRTTAFGMSMQALMDLFAVIRRIRSGKTASEKSYMNQMGFSGQAGATRQAGFSNQVNFGRNSYDQNFGAGNFARRSVRGGKLERMVAKILARG